MILSFLLRKTHNLHIQKNEKLKKKQTKKYNRLRPGRLKHIKWQTKVRRKKSIVFLRLTMIYDVRREMCLFIRQQRGNRSK